MQITAKEGKEYLREIDSLLICDNKKKKEILNSFKTEIDDFLDSNPETDYKKLIEVFGTPYEVAEELLPDESIENIRKKLNTAKWVKCGIICALASLLLYVSIGLLDAHMAHRGYSEETIIEYETYSDNQNNANENIED